MARRTYGSAALRGRPVGIAWPGGASSAALWWGSAVGPPLTLVAAVAVAAVRGDRGWLRRFGAVLALGQLAEPLLYRRSVPPGQAWARRSAALNVIAGSLLAVRGRGTNVQAPRTPLNAGVPVRSRP